MTIIEAIKKYPDGKFRRSKHHRDVVFKISTWGLFEKQNNKKQTLEPIPFTKDSLIADDWEIVKD